MYMMPPSGGRDLSISRFSGTTDVEMSVKTIRDNLADAINRVAYAGERVVLTRKRKGVAALVSMEDLAALQRLEDEADVKAARKALAEMKRKGERPIPLAEIKKRLGMK
jgi:prevent-host-death family protein